MDIVITKANKPYFGIEIKYTSSPTITKSLKIAIDDLKTTKNFIIIPGTDEFPLRKDIVVCGVSTFIKNYLN